MCAFAGVKNTLLVEHAVIGQFAFVIAQTDLATLKQQNRIMELVAVPPRRANQHAWPVFCERF